MNFQQLENEVLAEMYGDKRAATAAKETPMSEDSDPVTDADLAALAAEGQARLATDGAALRQAAWDARVRRAELEALQAPPTLEAPGGMNVSAGVQINEADWATLQSLNAQVSPLTGRRYVEDRGAAGQQAREALFAAQTAVLRGEKLDASMLAQIRANISSDTAEAAKLKARADADELARFRERHGS